MELYQLTQKIQAMWERRLVCCKKGQADCKHVWYLSTYACASKGNIYSTKYAEKQQIAIPNHGSNYKCLDCLL